jgi:hypothetical protein
MVAAPARGKKEDDSMRSVPKALLAMTSAAAALGCGETVPTSAPAGELAERLATGARQGVDRSGDVRPSAHAILDQAAAWDARRRGALTLAEARAPDVAFAFTVPATIRVWRRRLDGSTMSCVGRVDEIPFETYVSGVLPHEWIASWEAEALAAGAVAIRTYAAFWVNAGGKYDCADVDDTTATQVYEDEFHPATDAAVAATAGLYLVRDDSLVFAEYSAENGDPTADGVAEPLCAGLEVFGHGRGTCQWGTQRWAKDGKTFDWIALHYYPGAALVGAEPAPPIGRATLATDVVFPTAEDPASPDGDLGGSGLLGCAVAGPGAGSGAGGDACAMLLFGALLWRRRRAGRGDPFAGRVR